ncbi:unnamed protein product [Linum trigynum]|uniref:Uncharacterized protein n=1 Tax=Linum trigynum TaxID=586398 RepID=A0AAV2FN02_9ROSI
MRYLFQIGKSPISRFPTPTLSDQRFPTPASDDGFATSDGGLAFVPESWPQPLKAALPSFSSPDRNSDQRFRDLEIHRCRSTFADGRIHQRRLHAGGRWRAAMRWRCYSVSKVSPDPCFYSPYSAKSGSVGGR